MSHRKLQKEVDAIFKKIHEGLDLFNYYFQRHEASNNDSQREKLESDLKKEIKKLQKFRDQIKTWQLNESMEATIAPSKLQEHRKLVEEAMECYKEVEKNSKMKSFSNQSIMLAALDSGETELSEETLESIEYLQGIIDELNGQLEVLEEEYEKLSGKKARKNNLHAIEERKQELESFINTDNFHIEHLESLIGYLKNGKISAELISTIQDYLNFYVESNQDPDFIDDDTLYDELIKEAKQRAEEAANEDVSMSNDNDTTVDTIPDILLSKKVSETNSRSSPSPKPNPTPPPAPPAPAPAPQLSSKSTASPSPPKSSPAGSTPKIKPAPLQNNVLETPESLSPAIIKTLKPAVAPTKPVGALKWAAAAAGNSANDSPAVSNVHSSNNNGALSNGHSNGHINEKAPPKVETIPDSRPELKSEPKDHHHQPQRIELTPTQDKYVQVLKNSALSQPELELFSDTSLTSLPPGIQDLIVSFTATRKIGSISSKNGSKFGSSPSRNDTSKLLLIPKEYDQFKTSLFKPYLPKLIQLSSNDDISFVQAIKPPLQLLKLQSYWNSIRAQQQYDHFAVEIELLGSRNSPEKTNLINELTMVFFYGYYYGFTPVENLIAQTYLFRLGWRPYGSKIALQDQSSGDNHFNSKSHESKQNYYWFKCIKNIPSPPTETQEYVEYGDYQVFDLFSWEIYVKYGFRFDVSLCQLEPSTTLIS